MGLSVQNDVILHVQTRCLFDCVRLVHREFPHAPRRHRDFHLASQHLNQHDHPLLAIGNLKDCVKARKWPFNDGESFARGEVLGWLFTKRSFSFPQEVDNVLVDFGGL